MGQSKNCAMFLPYAIFYHEYRVNEQSLKDYIREKVNYTLNKRELLLESNKNYEWTSDNENDLSIMRR